MRVCLMNDNYYRSSGAAIAIRRIALAATDVDYYFAGCSNEELNEDVSWVPQGRYEQFALKSMNPVRVALELIRFRRWFKSVDCHLVHCHHRRIAALIGLTGIPVLYTGQLVFPPAAWFRILSPRHMTAITSSVASNLEETTGRRVIACIGNPVEFPDSPPELELEKIHGHAVCIARLDPVKGHRYLLKAWKILSDRGHRYHLHLVGEGNLRQHLQEQAYQDGIDELVCFHGFTKDIGEIVRRCLFSVLVSEAEGQGIVTLESASLGRPSLLTAVPGSIDLIPPERSLTNGVQFGDPAALADALEEWFARPQAVAAEGKNFFSFLKRSSDPSLIAHQYRQVYQQILQQAV